LSLPVGSAEPTEKSHYPGHATPAGLTRDWFGLFRFRSPLLTESRLLSLPVGNEMFHFPTFPPLALCVQARVTGHDSCRVSPFGNPRITARLAAPRGLSQPPTSFIGSWCQGIHRAPLLTWPQRCSRPLCSSQATGGPGLHPPPVSQWRWFGVDRSFRDGAPDPEGSRARVTEVSSHSFECVQIPQDPTARLGRLHREAPSVPTGKPAVLGVRLERDGLLVSVPPLSPTEARTSSRGSWTTSKLVVFGAP
jgi:hypothetical protein